MSAPYICLRCRQRANHFLRPFKSRTFISLSSPSKPEDFEHDSLLSATKQRKERSAKEQDGKHDARIANSSQQAKAVESVNSMLERLFQSTQRRRPELPVKSRYSQTLNPTYVRVEDKSLKKLKDDLATIQGMVDEDVPTSRVLDAMIVLPSFKHHASHRTRSGEQKTLLFYNTTLRDLLFKAIRERISLQGRGNTTAVVQIVHQYITCDVMREQWWHMILWELLAEFARSRTRSGEGGILSLETPKACSQQSLYLLADVIQVWKIFARTFGVRSRLSQNSKPESATCSDLEAGVRDQLGPSHDWEGLPRLNAMSITNRTLQLRFTSRFLHFFPRKAESPSTTTLAAAAAMTYISIRSAEKSSIISESLSSESRHFMDLITRIIWNTSSDEVAFYARFSNCLKRYGIMHAVIEQLYMEWCSLRQEAINCQRKYITNERVRKLVSLLVKNQYPYSSIEDTEDFMVTEEISLPMAPVELETSKLTSNLRKSARESDGKFALKLWKRQLDQMSTDKLVDESVFVEFLRTFFAVGRPDCATEVWNSMCKHGCKPSTIHWVTLLEGCKKARDLVSLKSIWWRMEAAEMQNTNQAWTVYISGLLLCKDWRSALEAIDKLGKAWKSSVSLTAPTSREVTVSTEQRTTHEADQFIPSMFPINAAISGLLGNHKPDLAQQVLAWAISEKLKPDTTTFNILLRPAVRHDNTEAVHRYLSEMKHHACDPDVVTFTILIDGIFRNPSSAFQTQTPEEQQALMASVFKDMQDNNIKAAPQTYSTILDGLLQPKYFNLPAARAVLARMTEQGLRPTPHTYTILVTHYFSLSPPDLAAIESLTRRIELEKSPVDHVFYDRMIEGYGRVGALDKMLAVLRRMPKEGKRPGWIALLGALNALVQAEEWELVRDLVRDVADEKDGLLRYGSRGWRGEEEFWEFVDDLKRQGVDLPYHREPKESGEDGEYDIGEEMDSVE